MTRKERVLRSIRHEELDFLPYQIEIDPSVSKRVGEYLNNADFADAIEQHKIGASARPPHLEEDDGFYTDAWGCRFQKGNIFHLVDPPLKEPSLGGYEFPDFTRDELYEHIPEFFEKYNDRFTIFGLGLMFFERSWCLRGFENILMDMVEHPKFCHELYDALMEIHLTILDRVLDYPFDAIQFGDDFGQQRGTIMGVRYFREYLLPRLKKMYATVKEAGKFVMIHSCGDIQEIIGDLVEIGLDIYNPSQPEANDLLAMKALYGDRLTFDGGLSTQRTLPRGTPEEVREEVRRCKAGLGRDGGLIIGPTKPILPDVPTENAIACIEEIIEKPLERK